MTRYWTRVETLLTNVLTGRDLAVNPWKEIHQWKSDVARGVGTLASMIVNLKAAKKELRGSLNPMRGLRLVQKAAGIKGSVYELDLAEFRMLSSSLKLSSTVDMKLLEALTIAGAPDFGLLSRYVIAMEAARLAASSLLNDIRLSTVDGTGILQHFGNALTILDQAKSTLAAPLRILIGEIQIHIGKARGGIGGGEGETSSYWPSSFIASSSSSSSTGG
jgi:hypothetical protein